MPAASPLKWQTRSSKGHRRHPRGSWVQLSGGKKALGAETLFSRLGSQEGRAGNRNRQKAQKFGTQLKHILHSCSIKMGIRKHTHFLSPELAQVPENSHKGCSATSAQTMLPQNLNTDMSNGVQARERQHTHVRRSNPPTKHSPAKKSNSNKHSNSHTAEPNVRHFENVLATR
jgi:hypothetical protein